MKNDADLDRISRDRIRKDINSSFFVEAGAGSGKTTLLVDRMAAMVEGGMDIGRICAITFTKAAASEFYARFQEKLAASDSAAAKQALKNIDLCFMGTIDSFCQMVLSEHPAKAGIPSNASVVSEDELKALWKRELSLIRRGSYGPALLDQYSRFRDCYHDADRIFMRGMKLMMANRDAAFSFAAPAADTVTELYAAQIDGLKAIFKHLFDHQEALDRKGKAQEEAAAAINDSIDVLMGNWDEKLEDVIDALKKLGGLRIVKEYDIDRLGPGHEKLFEKHFTKSSFRWYSVIGEGDPLLLGRLEDFRYSRAMGFISACVPLVSARLRAEGKLSFSDYLLYLRDMLRDDAAAGGKLTAHIAGRHSFFLIDEFQDTDPIQAEIFFYLAAKEPRPDWTECVPRPGALFIVGDPKQSIYRFRGADAASFKKVRALFSGGSGEVLQLSRNYRSTDRLCGWFNEVFAELLPYDTADQSRFEPIPMGEKPEYRARLNGAYRYDCGPSVPGGSEDPKLVAEIIRRLTGDASLTVQGRGEGDSPRALSCRDIMVITPSKKHMGEYMRAMSAAGIPFRVEGKVLFSDCPALSLITYVMSAAADPYSGKYRFALDSVSGCDIAEDALADFRKKAEAMSPAAFFSYVMDRERVFAKAGSRNMEYVYFALELLRQAEADGTVSTVSEGAAFLRELMLTGSDQERCIQLVKDTDRVHLANLHKVKGLQAPVVILADPRRGGSQVDHRVDHSGKSPAGYIFRLSSAVCSAFQGEKELEAQSLEAERLRLLYVAATRAENALIVSRSLGKYGDPLASDPWAKLNRSIKSEIFAVTGRKELAPPENKAPADAAPLYDEAERNSPLNDASPKDRSYRIQLPSAVKMTPLTEEGSGAEAAAHIRSSLRDPALAGTMTHRVMEMLVSSRNRADAEALVTQTLREYGADENYYRPVLRSVVEKMRSGGYEQAGNVPRDILSELLAADEVYCELPLCCKEGDVIWHGIMDVVYRKGGAWRIVDYKTSADGDDLDERYRAQLEAYKKAFREITGSSADALIYHIDLAAEVSEA